MFRKRKEESELEKELKDKMNLGQLKQKGFVQSKVNPKYMEKELQDRKIIYYEIKRHSIDSNLSLYRRLQ